MHGLILELQDVADEFLRLEIVKREQEAKPGTSPEALAVGTHWRVRAVGQWKEALAASYSLAKADRARELRGDRTVARFNEQGLHPFSAEWGRMMALEAMLPGLSDVREKLKVNDNGEVTELFVSTRVLRLEAREAAEEEYRDEIIAAAIREPGDA